MQRAGRLLLSFVLLAVLGRWLPKTQAGEPGETALRFEVGINPRVAGNAGETGRLLIVLGRPGGEEPKRQVGRTGLDASPILGRDVSGLTPGQFAVVDHRAVIFPIDSLR